MVVLASQQERALLLHEVEAAIVQGDVLLNCFINLVAVMAESIDLELVIENVASLAGYLFARSSSHTLPLCLFLGFSLLLVGVILLAALSLNITEVSLFGFCSSRSLCVHFLVQLIDQGTNVGFIN